jgi:hypothetical protein
MGKKVISKSFLYFYPKSFFLGIFSYDPVSCFVSGTLNLFLYAFKPFHQIFLSCAFLTWNPIFLSFLLDGLGNSGCTLLGRTHICALGIIFCEVGKDGEGGYQTIEEGFFFSFYQKIKDEKTRWQTIRDALSSTS